MRKSLANGYSDWMCSITKAFSFQTLDSKVSNSEEKKKSKKKTTAKNDEILVIMFSPDSPVKCA